MVGQPPSQHKAEKVSSHESVGVDEGDSCFLSRGRFWYRRTATDVVEGSETIFIDRFFHPPRPAAQGTGGADKVATKLVDSRSVVYCTVPGILYWECGCEKKLTFADKGAGT